MSVQLANILAKNSGLSVQWCSWVICRALDTKVEIIKRFPSFLHAVNHHGYDFETVNDFPHYVEMQYLGERVKRERRIRRALRREAIDA